MNKTFSKGMAIAPLLAMGAAGITSAHAADSSTTVDDTSNPVSSVSAASTTGGSTQTDLASAREQILAETNAVRAEAGLAPVKLSDSLNSIAQSCSEEQAANQQMAHCTGFYDKYPEGWTTASENVAYGYSLDKVTDAWRNSSGHYANMVDSKATHLGIGIAYDSTGTPYYTQNYAGYENDPDGSADNSSNSSTETSETVAAENTGNTVATDTAAEQDNTVTTDTTGAATGQDTNSTEQDTAATEQGTQDATVDDTEQSSETGGSWNNWDGWEDWTVEDGWANWDYTWDWWYDSAQAENGSYDWDSSDWENTTWDNSRWQDNSVSASDGGFSPCWEQWGSWPTSGSVNA